jgi:hypothetical protein
MLSGAQLLALRISAKRRLIDLEGAPVQIRAAVS